MPSDSAKSLIIVVVLACLGLFFIALSRIVPGFQSDVIHQVESPYQSVYISESNGIRSMHVGSLRDKTSAMDIDAPLRHVYEYTAMMMLALGYVEKPQRFLVVGLGGGTVTRTLRTLYPEAHIVNIEFDPEVVNMARAFFNYTEDERMELVVQDVRRWLRATSQTFDIIFLDAYHGGYIPFHLTTREFLSLVREHLSPGGVACSNTWSHQRLANRESATYHAVFGRFHNYFGRRTTNRIIVAARESLPSPEAVRQRLVALDDELRPRHLDLSALFHHAFRPGHTWPDSAKVLTDDHAPVNLLKDQG